MAQRIHTHQETNGGDGFQFKPERIEVVSLRKTFELQARVYNLDAKLTLVKTNGYAKAEWVQKKKKFSLTSILSIVSIITTLVGILIAIVDIIN